MNQKSRILKELSKKSSSNLRETFEFRVKNKWLSYSAEIAKRIAAAIENDEELNQARLAEILQVSPQQVSKILKGHENLTLESIYKISQALNTELISFPDYKYSFSTQQLLRIQEMINTETSKVAYGNETIAEKSAKVVSIHGIQNRTVSNVLAG